MMYKAVLSFCLFALSCGGCDESHGVRLLDRDYKLAVGILAPDSVRNYRHEIFFGKIVDKEYKDFNTIPQGEDVELNRCLLAIRDNYRGEITGNENAEIYVENKDGGKVSFVHVGNGIYRDSINALKVFALDKYNLVVKDKSRTYTATTIVPGNFQFMNLTAGDTINVEVFPLFPGEKNAYRGTFVSKTNQSQFANLYRFDVVWNLLPPPSSRFYHSMLEQRFGFGVPMVVDSSGQNQFKRIQSTTIVLQSIDSCYTQMYSTEPPSSAGLSDSLWHWIIAQDEMSIRKRSNIEGSDDVAGVFGSYNKTKEISFFMRAKFPSSKALSSQAQYP